MAMAVEPPNPSDTGKGWSVREVIQGKPMKRPTHPFFVVFPIALWSGTLVLDVLSFAGLDGAALAATYAAIGGLIGAAFAIVTGLADRSSMRPGSRIRGAATQHMAIQLTATAIFLVNVLVRWGDRTTDKAKALWLILDVLGVGIVILGGDAGAKMVFRMGYRVAGAEEK
jgi:uncharacterized membrane protein